MARDYTAYLTWINQEFLPLILATPQATQIQILENAIRFWNTNSAYKITTMFDYAPGVKRIQLNTQFKAVADVYPSKTTAFVWNNHPLWSLMGMTVLDNVTGDLILMSEAFRNYQVYVGADFQWVFDKSDDPTVGGYLYCVNIPSGTEKICVMGTKRITADEDIKPEPILDWIYRYSKALLKQVEGNTLRKSSIIGIANDGQQMVDEGRDEMKDLQDRLSKDSRWIAFLKRF
jgi:hypothetical protein